ncbi:transcription antiterminator BglG [Paenibacillus sp. FSL P4-0081]|uniref:BglG family transcription antiterminator LicT n=1 Tax=Paenibacillus sp. FSL P4-0081 TaxID=1536769 RepID=UPI0004F5E897|nr:PRD domain-containing protein [Paenibacillus sp. FSL P4-0081]AIQ31402.1 transcription antiterminator BglG [Paenibacillus sp. FSL P4-0081]
MRIKKVFNNNVALVEGPNRSEIIVIGKGLAYQKTPGEDIDPLKIEKTFVMETKELSERLSTLLSEIPPKHLELTDQIIRYAAKDLSTTFSNNIYLALTDHISYAITRTIQGLSLKNALLWEIQKFYPKEFHAATHALHLIEKETGIKLPVDEAGFIAMHFVNGQQDGQEMEQTLLVTQMVQGILNIVTLHYGIELDENSLNYSRFVTHLKYFSYRTMRHESIPSEDDELYQQVVTKYPEAFSCSEKVRFYLREEFQVETTEGEMVYFMLHIRRVTSRD